MQGEAAPKYWAFISYSHADARWAEWLHKALESYRIPARLVGRKTAAGPVPRKLFPVFRDRDELAGSSELGPALQKALREARYQIVIASPNAAASRWVDEEIRYFKSLGRSSRVLALLVDGEPNATDKGEAARECFPAALRYQVDADGRISDTPAELIAADARKGADGKANAKLKLIAGLLGVGFDELRQRELQARNRRLAVLASIASAVSAVTVVLAVLAYQAANDALRRQQQAEDLLQFMLGDLRGKLEPIGKLAILDSVGQKAMDYFATLEQRDLTDAALSSRATALRQIGEVRTQRGDLPGASEAYAQALRLDEELAARHPTDARYLHNVGNSEFSMGYAHYLKGEIDQARPWFRRYAATADRVLELEPDKPDWINASAVAHNSVGILEVGAHRLDDAQASFERALSRQRKLVEQEPGRQEYLAALADIHSGLWGVATERRDWATAQAEAARGAELRRKVLDLAPDNAGFQLQLGRANLVALSSEEKTRAIAADDPVLRETLRLCQSLVELDPENIEYARTHVIALNYLVDAHLAYDHLTAAEQVSEQLLTLARETWARAPDKAESIDDLLAVLAQRAKLAWLRNDRAEASRYLGEARALALSAEQREASSPSRWLDLTLLEWWMARGRAASDALRQAADEGVGRLRAAGATLKPELMLRYAALKGDRVEAGRWFGELTEVERQHPFLRQFCRATGACTAVAGG